MTASPISLTRCPTAFDQNVGNLQDIAFFGQDLRQTFHQWSKGNPARLRKLHKKYRATGQLSCDGYTGNAHLTGDSRTLVTVAHMFANKDCTTKDISSCFYVDFDGMHTKTYKLKEGTLKKGQVCPIIAGSSRDWAVVQLENPIDGVTPYRIPPEPFPYRSGQPITAVSAYMEDMDPNPPAPTMVIQKCAMDRVDVSDKYQIKSACSFSAGSSGTGEFVDSQNGTYLSGIHSNLIEYPNAGDAFNLQRHYNADTAVTGEFRQAILDANARAP